MIPPADLLLVRHGESEWNVGGLATGWADVGLTPRGREQAIAAGTQLAREGQAVDIAFTSLLARARQTADHLLAALESTEVPVLERWQLNERHVGQLQGMEKQAIRDRWGNAARRRWRSDFEALPPPLPADDPRHPVHQPRFRAVPQTLLPASERLADLRARVLGLWRAEIVPALGRGTRVLVVAHRDSLRVLIAEIEHLEDARFPEISVPPALPRAYRLCGKALKPASSLSRMRTAGPGTTLRLPA